MVACQKGVFFVPMLLVENIRISIFISYSHDSESHRANVLSLSDRLKAEGLDCEIDRYVEGNSPERGWPIWMEERLRLSDFVLITCTETYLRRCEGREIKGSGLGVIFESILLLENLYENGFINTKFIPIVFDEKDFQFIPAPLKSFTRYNISRELDYKSLYRRLTKQIEIVKPPLGKIVVLPSAVNLISTSIFDEISSIKSNESIDRNLVWILNLLGLKMILS